MLRVILLSLALIVSCQNVYQVTFQNAATCPAPANMLISVIYSQTNNPAGNMLLSFAHYSNGLMAPTSSSTGGMGSVSGLGSQGSVVLDPSGRWLYSVDGGSNSIAAFNVAPNTGALTLAKSFSTNGTNPRSLSIYGNRLFALFNTSVQAFTIADDGSLSFMANWPLNISSNPAQVAVTLSGMVVIVTEKNTNMITTFAFDSNTSSYRGPMSFPSSGQTPFGFSLNQAGNILYVTEAAGGAAGASSLSSYWIYPNGTLVPISRSVATTQTSACWAVTIGNIVYASNPSSNSISSFMSTSSGTLTLKYAQAGTFPSPVEMVASQNGRMLYVAGGTPTNRTIGAFAVNSDSSLSMVTQSPPFSANNPAGLAIY